MRYSTPILAAAVLAACGGGGAATGPGDPPGENPTFTSLSVTPPAGELTVGGTIALTATPLDAAGNAMSGLPAPRWSSSAPGVASVGGDGTVTGLAQGSAIISAELTSGGTTRSATAQVVVRVGVAAVRLSHSDFTLAAGGTAQLTVTAVDAAGNPVPGVPAPTWQTDAPAVATISGGRVTAVGPGSATITASILFQGVSYTASVRVTVAGAATPSAATVQGVHHGFSPDVVTITVGGTVTWVMDDEEHDITWDGAAPPGGNIRRLDEDEQATRSFPTVGTYTYHCDHHDSRVEAGTVIVQAGGGGGGGGGATPVFTSVTLAPSPAAVAVGGTVQLSATARDQNGNPMAGTPTLAWQSSDATRATVSTTGVVTGVAAGGATITVNVTLGGVTRAGTVAVSVGTSTTPTTATVRTVDRSFSPRSVTIAAGGTVTWQFTETHNVTFRGGSPTGGNIGNQSSGTATRTFPTVGTFNYDCSLHSGMTGSVIVQ